MMRRTVLTLAWVLASVCLLLAGAFAFAQTDLGKRLIAKQISRALSDAQTSARVTGLQGLMPFDFEVEQLRLADAAGPWLEVDELRIAASPRALLRGRLDVHELSARRLALHRLPAGDDTHDAALVPALPASLPRVIVRSLAVDRLEIGAAVLGEDAVFGLSGKLRTGAAGRVADATLDLRRKDEDTARAALQARLDLADRTLVLDLEATETGGLLAGLTGRPEVGAFTLKLTGAGPLGDWQGDLGIEAAGLARAGAQIKLALGDATEVRIDGEFEPAPGLLPAPADALVGERLQLALTAVRTGPQQLAIEDLRATTARATLSGSGRLDLAAEHLVAQASLQVGDLAALQGGLKVPLAGSLDLSADVDGPLMQPQGRVRLAATDLAAGEVLVPKIRTTLDFNLLEPFNERGARVRVVAEGDAEGLRLPPEIALPPQDLVWQTELSAPVDRVGTVVLERLAASGDHLRLAAEGSLDASTLGGGARLTLTLDDLTAFARPYGQQVAGAAEFDANLALGAGAELISIDLYGGARELSGLPAAAGALVGAAPRLEANAIVVPDESIEVTHVRVQGSAITLDGRLDLALPEQTLDGAVTLDLPNLAPLAPLLGVELGGPLTADVRLGGAVDRPALGLAARSRGLRVANEHIDTLALTAEVEGTPEVADGKLRLAVRARNIEAALASDFELRASSLRLTDLALSAPRARVDGALSIDLQRQLVEGELSGRIEQLQALGALLPVRLAGALDLKAHASAKDGAQGLALAVQGNDLVSDFGRLRRLGLQATVADALRAPRIAADLALDDFAAGEARMGKGTVHAEGTAAALSVTVAASGEAQVPFDLDGRLELALEEPIQVRLEQLGGRLAEQPLSLARPATVTLARGSIAVDDLSLRFADAQLAGGFALGPQQVAAEARLERLPLAMLARFGAPELDGSLEGRLSLRGAAENPTGSVQLKAIDVALVSPTLEEMPPAELSLTGSLEARRLRLDLRGEGVAERPIRATAELPLVVDLAAGAFEVPGAGRVAGSLDAELALARLADILGLDDQRLEGPLRADLRLAGTVAAPAIDGTVRIDGALYENGTTGTVLRDVSLLATADRRTLTVGRFSATDGARGRLTGTGTLGLDPAADYPIDLRLRLEQARLVARDEVVATASGDLVLNGGVNAPMLGGAITVNRADVSIPERLGPNVVVIPVEEIGRGAPSSPAPDQGAGSDFALGLNLTVAMPGQVFVRGRGLDSEWEGQLRVAGTSAAPRVSGTLRVRRGGFELLGHRFDLRGGTIAFDGQTPPDPQLQIDAVTQAERITAIVRITGKATAPEFRLDSEPSLPEDEVLARLLFNRATSALGPADAVRLAAAANTLRGGGVGLLGRTRQTFGLDTLDVTGAGLQDGQVRAGKYLNDRVFVEVGKGAAADSEDVSVEIEILPSLSLDADANAQAQTGIGLKWRFDY
ncbi:MAG TPA: translocation/assembly module TamB domain-containing protein [Geminicoccaceae bacterium]|nr:translocation/assembly module TamB domain-containing protein [Geminicoccaceae bacterium]